MTRIIGTLIMGHRRTMFRSMKSTYNAIVVPSRDNVVERLLHVRN